jgi:hypothetical protein
VVGPIPNILCGRSGPHRPGTTVGSRIPDQLADSASDALNAGAQLGTASGAALLLMATRGPDGLTSG